MRLAPEQVIDHPVDRLLVARDDAGRKNHRVALLDLGMLVVVHRGPRQRRHRFALGSADQYADFLRREILHLARMDQQSFGNFDVAQVFGNLRRVVHRAADERDLAAMLAGHFHRQLDAMNGRRETGDEQPPLGAREDFVELAAHRALARRVALALDVGRVLQQREHALFAVFGKGVQIEEPVVGRRGIDFEVAGVNDDAQRRVNGERHAIHQAMRYLDRVNGEGADS